MVSGWTSRDRRAGTRLAEREARWAADVGRAAAPVLGDTERVFNLLAQLDRTRYQRVVTTSTITPTHTATLLTLTPSPGQVGVWRRLVLLPGASAIFRVILTRDGRQTVNDAAAIAELLERQTIWRKFFNSFVVTATNNDTTASPPAARKVIRLDGDLYWIERRVWDRLEHQIGAGVMDALG